ncbi:TM2 domain-containing protein [Bacillus wiedmannii]|uniref:TM2 domain-containing protein n=1 Tax=Bacillus wiedmannii TaxID=1890302 RepID=UPI002E214D0F|nr:TM2 domain-containing protein [Bacillus wiedmannii]
MKHKSKTLGYVLALFLGGLGAHAFYYKKYTRGILYFLFCWTYVPVLLGWIDMLFIKKWHSQLDGNRERNNNTTFSLAPSEVIAEDTSERVEPTFHYVRSNSMF